MRRITGAGAQKKRQGGRRQSRSQAGRCVVYSRQGIQVCGWWWDTGETLCRGWAAAPAQPGQLACAACRWGEGGVCAGLWEASAQHTAHAPHCAGARAVPPLRCVGRVGSKPVAKQARGSLGKGRRRRAREKGEGVRINCAGVSISYFSSSAGRGVQGGKATKSRLALRKITGATRRRPGPTAKFPLTPARARRRRLGPSRAAPRASR